MSMHPIHSNGRPPSRHDLKFGHLLVGTVTLSGTIAGLAIASVAPTALADRLALAAVVPLAVFVLCVFWFGYLLGRR